MLPVLYWAGTRGETFKRASITKCKWETIVQCEPESEYTTRGNVVIEAHTKSFK